MLHKIEIFDNAFHENNKTSLQINLLHQIYQTCEFL